MRKVLLLDFDHTLYPSTLRTLQAVDDRITLYIQTHLGLSPEAADGLRQSMCAEYGTTLRGLEVHHGVDKDHYCDFIHAIEDAWLPPPDPELRKWFGRLAHPVYLFTNARRDWPLKGLRAMGLQDFLPGGDGETAPASLRIRDIFDIAFVDWQGKPHPQGYEKVEQSLRDRHGDDILIHFADDRADNLQTARQRHWVTIWISPAPVPRGEGLEFDRVLSSLTLLDPETLE